MTRRRRTNTPATARPGSLPAAAQAYVVLIAAAAAAVSISVLPGLHSTAASC